MEQEPNLKLYFSDYFKVPRSDLDKYGAFDISLISDLPLFIDPFLLFQNPKYQPLHDLIIDYLKYLRDISVSQVISEGRLRSLFYFSEVEQNYLGFTFMGNKGHGLGRLFAHALNMNLAKIFTSFGQETITKGIHLEKLCLISRGVGRDTISDFVTNLIKEYLLSYTETFTLANIRDEYRASFTVERVRFNKELGVWTTKTFTLPVFNNSYVILTPKDMLTREENWINRSDYMSDFFTIVGAPSGEQLRADLDEYFRRVLSENYTLKQMQQAIQGFTSLHPELIDYYIKSKEDNGDKAIARSALYVSESELLFLDQFGGFAKFLNSIFFYKIGFKTMFLKDAIENKGCWKIFYNKDKPITREEDLHVLFRLVWYGTKLNVSREVNDGIGPVDFEVSNGLDKTLVEFKLARNSHLRDNLHKQLELYKKASDAEHGFKVIIYFSPEELVKVNAILAELNMSSDANIILIDATKKVSASKVK
jgi:hypothetical protein